MVYTGPHALTDVDEVTGVTVGKMVLSPTRTYLPIVTRLLRDYRPKLKGLIHCTGGGQAKCMKFVDGVHVIKDTLFETPRLFELIQAASGTSWEEMYQVFNMGNLLEVFTDETTAQAVMDIATELGVEARVIGRVEAAETNRLTIRSAHGEFVY